MKPVLFLTALAASSSAPERPARESLMDEIERQVRLPSRANKLNDYGRYYAFEGKRRVKGIYILPPEPVTPDPLPADWGCEEVVVRGDRLTSREVACPPEPDVGRFLKAGQRRWFANPRALPFVADGGCMVVHVVFDLETSKVEQAFCNGHG